MMQRIASLLERAFGRMPIGWHQLVHNRTRLFAAVAGVTFANVLIFMQLGFKGGLVGSIQIPYDQMHADLILSASDMNTLADGGPLPRQRLYEALSIGGVREAAPVYYAKVDWKQPDGTLRSLDTFGIDPSKITFQNAEINAQLGALSMADTALMDRRTRNVPKGFFSKLDSGAPYAFETRNRTLTVLSAFTMGGGISTDGYLVVSDQTFLRLFPQRSAGAPNHVFVTLQPGARVDEVAARIRAFMSAEDTVVRTIPEVIAKDVAYQTTQRPVGIIFGFGVLMGVIVGVIIVYQVLSTDVSDHLKEYATFKAIGYSDRFFLGIVFEQALILATLGFVPGLGISMALYRGVTNATGLPLHMSLGRALAVLLGTMAMCALSGAIATRRLARANPAELF